MYGPPLSIALQHSVKPNTVGLVAIYSDAAPPTTPEKPGVRDVFCWRCCRIGGAVGAEPTAARYGCAPVPGPSCTCVGVAASSTQLSGGNDRHHTCASRRTARAVLPPQTPELGAVKPSAAVIARQCAPQRIQAVAHRPLAHALGPAHAVAFVVRQPSRVPLRSSGLAVGLRCRRAASTLPGG